MVGYQKGYKRMGFLEVITVFAMGYFAHWFKWLVTKGGLEKLLDSLE